MKKRGIKNGRRRRNLVESLESRRLLAVFQVTTAADVVDSGDGVVSLREAIDASNAAAGLDTIEFSPTLNGVPVVIGAAGSTDNTNAAGDFDITDDVDIIGNGMSQTIVDGDFQDRVFDVLGSLSVSFQDLTIRNGEADTGGGLRATSADITLLNTHVTGNRAVGELIYTPGYPDPFAFTSTLNAEGGGIHKASAGLLTITNSLITNNTAVGRTGGSHTATGYAYPYETFGSNGGNATGGGVRAQNSTVTITGSRIEGNQAIGGQGGDVSGAPVNRSGTGKDGGFAQGGGLSITNGSLLVQESSVTGNDSIGGMGSQGRNTNGIYIPIISGNASDSGSGGHGFGGGIQTDSTNVTLTNATVSGNSSLGGNGGDGGDANYVPPVGNPYGNPSIMQPGDGGDGGDGSDGEGGGIWATGGSINTTNLTIAGNSARPGKAGRAGLPGDPGLPGIVGAAGSGSGGGIQIDGSTSFNATATLVGDNIASTGPDVLGAFTSAASVLLEDTSGATGITAAGGNILGLDPHLAPLDSSGATVVLPILPSSPALDATTLGETTDQVGTARTQGASRDIGAYEVPLGTIFVVNSTGDGPDTNLFDGLALDASGNTTLRAAIQQANFTTNVGGPDLIRFDISGTELIVPINTLPVIVDPVVIDGTSEPDYAGMPVVQIENPAGTNPGGLSFGLRVSGGGTTIAGLSITNFFNYGIDLIGGDDNVVGSNFLGISPSEVAGPNDFGLRVISSDNNFVIANTISGNGRAGVFATGTATGNTLSSNRIGTNVAGTAAIPNGTDGITMFAAGNTIADNTISGNTRWGVFTSPNGDNNVIQGNRIGTDTAGVSAVPNLIGVYLQGDANLVGGTNPELGNLISGNLTIGLASGGSSAVGNTVQANLIGLDVSGTLALPNGAAGIQLASATNTTIGGSGDEGNTISGNLKHGVLMLLSGTSDNQVIGNRIGTDISGTTAVGNVVDGVRIVQGAANNTVRENQISGNGKRGVSIDGINTTGNDVLFNLIGTDSAGTAALLNGVGGGIRALAPEITIEGNVITSPDAGVMAFANATDLVIRDNFIGTDTSKSATTLGMPDGVLLLTGASGASVESNVIANNGIAIAIKGSIDSVKISQNSIFDNTAIGIDLGDNGTTVNDHLDLDAGANNLQNTPVLSAAGLTGDDLALTYLVNSSRQKSTYALTIEFFVSDGSGQGKKFIGSDVYTSASATAAKSLTLDVGDLNISVGDVLVATATDASGNSSEFSVGFTVA